MLPSILLWLVFNMASTTEIDLRAISRRNFGSVIFMSFVPQRLLYITCASYKDFELAKQDNYHCMPDSCCE
jgi:hypothetical protein